ncbi:PREDICTED: probable inactive histone-lysine N-methyltransferase SUVR2 isoform X2 [Camelina sativa]|uniref:Probable inactive histone-lysine N-methyltransferase SUVR2 isoform X2 n=1 Tax=Camelina sativa TaxID=90675 RepID=A0ABM0Y2C7_CAMSA|nr:PREDICTED: probable inactive histone-lysine N-methyltransferase SUVR2 isoform X2 [Camelina sativa]
MAPNAHIKKAFLAMRALGIKDAQVKPVLKDLLTLYDKNWELIAEDNYRVLADAIFDSQEAQAIQESKGKKVDEAKEDEEGCASEVGRGKKKFHESIEEDDEALAESDRPLKRLRRRGEGGSALTSPSLDSPNLEETPAYGEESGLILLPFHPVPTETHPDAGELIVPKDELITDMPSSSFHSDSVERGDSSVLMLEMEKTNGHVEDMAGETVSTVDGITNDVSPITAGRLSEQKLASTVEDPSALELASSALGEVKLNLSFAPATRGTNQHVPSMEELRRAMEEKCLRSYKILDPNFSVIGFMNDICSCYLDLATKGKDSSNQMPKPLPFVTTNIDALKKSAASMAFTSQGSNDHMGVVENVSVDDSMGLVVVPECQLSADEWRLISSIGDITLGKETIEIPWVNEVNDKVPPVFRYIAQSLVYQDAAVKFSLGNIKDDQCCSSCCGDCLAPSMGCSCATAFNGFAYTADGLLQNDFLEQCISEARDPQKQIVQYCKECPFEKAQKEVTLEPCKGHLKRKVIKECWNKCGCMRKCGNRVVQQGIHNKLQVFFTPNGRGWGLRTLEKLPKGAFICEFAGEILTVPELFQRNSERRTSPVILDAYWGSEDISGADKALCLDVMHYGNISRFINHRCLDANLIEIPVHVETTDSHYYHPAFFTTREIDAMEELTWDYGVRFNNDVFPTSPFHCRCGSEFCRIIKQISRKNVKKRA